MPGEMSKREEQAAELMKIKAAKESAGAAVAYGGIYEVAAYGGYRWGGLDSRVPWQGVGAVAHMQRGP